MERAKRQSEQVTGVSNVAYDLMIVLTNKLEGIAAMEEYKLDAEEAGDQEVRALFERIVRRERDEIEELRTLLLPRLQRAERGAGAATATDMLVGRSQGRGRASRSATQTADGLVDEASAESFPASDPPSFTTGQRHDVTSQG